MNTAKDWQHNPKWDGKFSYRNAAFLVITPLLTLTLLPFYIYYQGFAWSDLFLFFALSLASGISITAGYHRLFSHQSYECSPLVKLFYLLFGAAAFENSAYKWSSDHRYHHRFVDKEGDPYNIQKGFFHAHMGWIFLDDPEGRSYENIRDLQKDPLVRWQHKYFLYIAVVVGFLLPTALGACFGRPLAGFLWGGLLRIVILHHGTFFINSAAHVFGTQPYSLKNSARDSWWLAFFTHGEGFHNFHHAFANDYRNGILWYHWDPSKWIIFSMSYLGLARDLNRTPDWQILRAKLSSTHENVQTYAPIQYRAQLNALKETIEKKIQILADMSRDQSRQGVVRLRYFRLRMRAQKRSLQNAWEEYLYLVRLATQLNR